ncbi:hypothetical protein CPB85DRAFT_1255354 [Mucidula mucida]|nr:hypothetical protein CPB85DRAFT_1255354 [Mucidula mucida]
MPFPRYLSVELLCVSAVANPWNIAWLRRRAYGGFGDLSRVHQVGMTLNEIEWDIRRAEEPRATSQKRAALASLNDRHQSLVTMTFIILASLNVEMYSHELLQLEVESSRMQKKTRLLGGRVIVRHGTQSGTASTVDLNEVDIGDGIEEE